MLKIEQNKKENKGEDLKETQMMLKKKKTPTMNIMRKTKAREYNHKYKIKQKK